ncbi:MAG: GNAT family N-acetyltransferase [Terriglobales bacterium]|jgi:predicted GNAT superfamily acetyltransferase
MATGKTAGIEPTVNRSSLLIRKCQGLDEMRACVALQKEVWGFADIELVPLRMFVVAEKVGGQVIGAFAGNQLVAFAFAVPGVRDQHAYLYSHMLAVREPYRNAGLGRRLKLAQRDDALSRGLDLMEWTFDPLEIKNSYFNLERLGAIARRYNVNQYGITSSPLQGGLPTDRLVAEWWLKSKRVEQLLATGKNLQFTPVHTISVPAQIYDWKADMATRNQALQIQERNREAFQKAFAGGLAAFGYRRDPQGNGEFLLGPWAEGLS